MDLYDVSDIVSTSLDDLGIQLDTNNTTEDSTKDIKERYTEKPVVPQVRAGEFDEDVDETLTQIENAKYASVQDPITRDNFYQHTACNWRETNDLLTENPDYKSDSGSMYWYTEDGVYRTSNHWGFGVGSCDWTLNSNPELSHRDEEGMRTGFAKWTDFTHTDEKTFPQIVEMLTPKEAGLIGETDQDTEVYYDNYRSRQLEPKEDFVEDVTYPAGIETRLYTQCAAEGEGAQPTNVVNKVEENTVDNVSDKVVDPVSGQNGTPRNYGNKKPGATSFKNYAFELTTIEKIAEEMVVEADLESKKPYLLKQLNKADITGDEAEKVITQINEVDPTGNYARYTDWLLGQYLKGDFKLEDKEEAKELLKTFNEETQSKRLKGINIKEKKYQDLKAILEDHLGTKDKASNKLSKELEGTEAQFLTSYTDDETGDKYDLIRVTTPEDAEKLFSGTEWCVRHPDTAEDYLKRGDFYLLRKNGKNYLLKHPDDFKYVDDTNPSDDMVEEFETVFNNQKNISPFDKLQYHISLTSEDEHQICENINFDNSENAVRFFYKYWSNFSEEAKRDLLTKSISSGIGIRDIFKFMLPSDFPAYKDVLVNMAYNSNFPVENIKSCLEWGVLNPGDSEYENAIKFLFDKYCYGFLDRFLTHSEFIEYFSKFNKSSDEMSEPTPLDESSNDDTTKESAFEFTDINKLADFVQEFNRQDELTDEQKNKFVNHLPVEEANKDLKDELIEDAKQTGKVITHIPKSLNYPYIEDEMAGNKLFYSDLDWMEMSDLSEM